MRVIRLFKRDFSREIDEWLEEGLITQAQHAGILARYGIPPGESGSLGYRILVGLGLFFIGLSLITLIGANWDEIPRYLRTSGLFALTAGTQLAGWQFYRQGHNSRAVGALFLGNIFYGATIILIAQIYHLGEHMPDGVYWWALGCLPFALVTRSLLITLQMLLLAWIWLLLEAGMGYFSATFPIFIVASSYVLRKVSSSMLFLGSMLGLLLWLEFCAAWFWSEGGALAFELEHVVLTAGLAIFATGFGRWLMARPEPVLKDYGTALDVWCLRFLVLYLLALSFESSWENLLGAKWSHMASLLFICVSLWAAGLYLAWRVHSHYFLVVAGLLVGSVLTMVWSGVLAVVVYQLVTNLVVVGLGIYLVIEGVRSHNGSYFWTGLAAILFLAMVRYIDLIGGYVGGSILFLLIAAMLLGAARFWRSLEASNE